MGYEVWEHRNTFRNKSVALQEHRPGDHKKRCHCGPNSELSIEFENIVSIHVRKAMPTVYFYVDTETCWYQRIDSTSWQFRLKAVALNVPFPSNAPQNINLLIAQRANHGVVIDLTTVVLTEESQEAQSRFSPHPYVHVEIKI